jgi:hypothetical protein
MSTFSSLEVQTGQTDVVPPGFSCAPDADSSSPLLGRPASGISPGPPYTSLMSALTSLLPMYLSRRRSDIPLSPQPVSRGIRKYHYFVRSWPFALGVCHLLSLTHQLGNQRHTLHYGSSTQIDLSMRITSKLMAES